MHHKLKSYLHITEQCCNIMSSDFVFYTTSESAVCNASKLVCSDGFYVGDKAGLSGCRPECGEWEEFPHGSVLTFDILIVLQAVVSIVSTVILMVLSTIRYKRM